MINKAFMDCKACMDWQKNYNISLPPLKARTWSEDRDIQLLLIFDLAWWLNGGAHLGACQTLWQAAWTPPRTTSLDEETGLITISWAPTFWRGQSIALLKLSHTLLARTTCRPIQTWLPEPELRESVKVAFNDLTLATGVTPLYSPCWVTFLVVLISLECQIY